MNPRNNILLFSLIFIFRMLSAAEVFAVPENTGSFRAFNKGNFNRAITEFRRRANKGEIEGYLDLAVALKDLGYPGRAVVILRKALNRFGDDERVLSLLGRIYYLEGRTAEAIRVLRRQEKENPETLIILGLSYREEGDEEKAVEVLEQAVALDGSSVVARLSLADLYYGQNDLKRSAEQYKKISLIDASLQTIHKCWADILMQTGNVTEAFKVYEKIMMSDPKNSAARAQYEEARAKLGKAFFEKEREKKETARKSKKLTVSAVRPRSTETVIVGLGSTDREIRFSCSGDFTAVNKGGKRFSGREGSLYTVKARSGEMSIETADGKEVVSPQAFISVAPVTPGAVFTILSVKAAGGTFWANTGDRSFRGEVQFTAEGEKIRILNMVNLEEYLYGVVPSEMPSDWPLEALKAQAVCARSEAMSKMGRHNGQGYDFCAEVHCQAYGGVEKESARTNEAVDSTRGLIMVSGGKPVDAVYSSNCGGHTQNNIFGSGARVSYLQGKPDTGAECRFKFPLSPYVLEEWLKSPPQCVYCNTEEESRRSAFRWVRLYSQEELRDLLEKTSPYPLGTIRKIVVTRRMESGHIASIRVVGTESEYEVDKELPIRKAFGDLRSSMFKVEARKNRRGRPEQFIFYGGGWGHGVGMCQTGAGGMAGRGDDYRKILRHYYTDTDFRSLY